MSHRLRHLRDGIGNVALTIMAVLGLVCIAVLIAGALFGVRPVIIRSGSMTPTITTGSLVLARETPASSLHVRDVVTVPWNGSHVTHRIYTVTQHDNVATLRLKGDANPAPDDQLHQVTSADRVFMSVPYLGYAIAWLSSPPGVYLLAGFVALMILLIMKRAGGSRSAPSGHRRSKGRGRKAAGVGVLAMSVIATASPSWAGWGDSVSATGTTVAAYTVPKPALPSCSINKGFLGLGPYVATITWPGVASPFALTYKAVIRQSPATTLTVVTSGSNRSVQVSKSILGSLLGGTIDVDITASLPITPSWASVNADQKLVVALLGLGLACGAAS